MKKILITGKNSYIGTVVAEYLEAYNKENGHVFQVDKISLRENWQEQSFAGYDAIVHVAGKAHVDVTGVSEEVKQEYYQVNAQLPRLVARKAKSEGVAQFIHLSSVILYGDSAGVGKDKMIDIHTEPAPTSFYGDSKLQGEKLLEPLGDDTFRVAILRLPLVYGKGSKGNFPLLEKIAVKTPLFPGIENKRSMIYVENLAEFIRQLIENNASGLFFPQNEEYVTTARMVQLIGEAKGKRIRLWKLLNPFVWLASKIPGKVGALVNKAFGSLTVEQQLSRECGLQYQKYSLEESIRRIYED